MTEDSVWQLEKHHRWVSHPSGLCLRLTGPVNDPAELMPMVIPNHLPPHRLVALLREGAEFCRKQQPLERANHRAVQPGN